MIIYIYNDKIKLVTKAFKYLKKYQFSQFLKIQIVLKIIMTLMEIFTRKLQK